MSSKNIFASKQGFSVSFGMLVALFLSISVAAKAEDEFSGTHLIFTPALVGPKDGYGWGGGVDPELLLNYGRGIYLGLGLRAGGYFAKDQFGIVGMPTVRLTITPGSWELYGAYGIGYGTIPKAKLSDVANMYRGGLVYHFSKKFSLGLEGTQQEITNSNFKFFSLGSKISIRL